jgi:hypothetical protein
MTTEKITQVPSPHNRHQGENSMNTMTLEHLNEELEGMFFNKVGIKDIRAMQQAAEAEGYEGVCITPGGAMTLTASEQKPHIFAVGGCNHTDPRVLLNHDRITFSKHTEAEAVVNELKTWYRECQMGDAL